MALGTTVLDTHEGTNALAGASDLILRNENLEGLIRDVGLFDSAGRQSRHPSPKGSRDHRAVRHDGREDAHGGDGGKPGKKIDVPTEKGDLTIKVEWSDCSYRGRARGSCT